MERPPLHEDMTDTKALAEMGLTQAQLMSALVYFMEKGSKLVKDADFCHCNSDSEVLVTISRPKYPYFFKFGCPNCSEQCPSCDNFTDELLTIVNWDGTKQKICWFCAYNDTNESEESDDMDTSDGEDIEARVDRILRKVKENGEVIDSRQRLISDFFTAD